jgi:protein-L-isoaspartate O-methyltransferase
MDQLKDPGILVVPIKQSIFQFKKENGKVTSQEFPGFAFVPMVQKEG